MFLATALAANLPPLPHRSSEKILSFFAGVTLFSYGLYLAKVWAGQLHTIVRSKDARWPRHGRACKPRAFPLLGPCRSGTTKSTATETTMTAATTARPRGAVPKLLPSSEPALPSGPAKTLALPKINVDLRVRLL